MTPEEHSNAIETEWRRQEAEMATETMYAIRRTDGEPIHGEWSFAIVDGPDDWGHAEEDSAWSEVPVGYELVRMTVEVMGRRTLPMCAESRCDHLAEFWGLCEKHAREDDEEILEKILAERNAADA